MIVREHCQTCDGHGWEPCPACKDDRYPDPHDPCAYCDGAEQFECETCHGKGYIELHGMDAQDALKARGVT